MRANELIERLSTKFPFDKGWLGFQEIEHPRTGRRIDWFGVHTWQSRNARTIAVEIKVSRADFQRELDDPSKRLPWEETASEFWFCCAKGVVEDVSEIPDGCGLWVPHGAGLTVKRRAHFTKDRLPTQEEKLTTTALEALSNESLSYKLIKRRRSEA